MSAGTAQVTPATLALRHLGIDTYRENVAFLSRRCSAYRPEDFQAFTKIDVWQDGRHMLATLNIVDDDRLLGPEEIGLSRQAFGQLGLGEGARVHVAPARPPASLEAVRAKIHGRSLSDAEINGVIRDIAANRYSKMEIAAFLIGCSGFLTTGEVLGLTRAMADAGTKLSWNRPMVVDKHCIGGIPGNRTSMLVVPIAVAHGLTMPKTSSRAITSPAGTADTMEVLANVDLDIPTMRRVVESIGGCLAWGGHVNLSPADDMLISVERPLGIDTPEQMVASILSKKLAAGSTHLLVDIPLGPSAKVRSLAEAIRLRKLFEFVGDRLGLRIEVVVTEAVAPIGRGIGPVLEARDVMAVLRGEPTAPADLREKAVLLAGRILDFDPLLRGGQGAARARELLISGAALAAMERIIEAQGPARTRHVLGPLTTEVHADKGGVVTAIDCHRLARIARLAGAPLDKGAGIDLFVQVGQSVRIGDPLYRIHACVPSDFAFAAGLAGEDHGFTVS